MGATQMDIFGGLEGELLCATLPRLVQ
jgi:hypothetical protein